MCYFECDRCGKIYDEIEMDFKHVSEHGECLCQNCSELDKMRKVYDEFGLDVHSIPINVQSQINLLVKEIIKLRAKKDNGGN